MTTTPETTVTSASETDSLRETVLDLCAQAKDASLSIAQLSAEQKNAILLAAADRLVAEFERILEANAQDIAAGEKAGLTRSLIDRLSLDKPRIKGIAGGLKKVAALPDPIGEVIQGRTLPNGLQLTQVRVPLGVMGMVYEARPNVTVDAFGLALKSGNAAVLRGSKSALRSNSALVSILREVLAEHGVDPNAVVLLPARSHDSVQHLITARGLVDLVIPRGGAGLIEAVVTNATVPTIETGTGNCHLFIHRDVDLDEAIALLLNGKLRRTSVCNATETVLLDRGLGEERIGQVLAALTDAGVTIHGEEEGMVVATESDWAEEYLSEDIAAKIVDDVDAAIAHIRTYSSKHTEAIATSNYAVATRFATLVDAAAVNINASTAFTDGEEFGMGAEIGISTQKLHARGPMGLPELTSTKWIVRGTGQTRP